MRILAYEEPVQSGSSVGSLSRTLFRSTNDEDTRLSHNLDDGIEMRVVKDDSEIRL